MWKTNKSRWQVRQPCLPQGIRIYAVGDIHGRADLLVPLLDHIDADIAQRPIARPVQVFLGDYIDRGPGSRQILDTLVAGSETCETVHLRGNHEGYVAEFLRDPSVLEEWRRYGGLETLISYGLKPQLNPDTSAQRALATAFGQVFPAKHRDWLDQLSNSFVCGDFFFVHAGVRPGIALARQRPEDLLWIRDDFLLHEEDFPKMIVHGHTPVAQPDFRPNRINIDTGAYATGRLTCLVLERDEVRLL